MDNCSYVYFVYAARKIRSNGKATGFQLIEKHSLFCNAWLTFGGCEWKYQAAFRKGLGIYKGTKNIYTSVWIKLLERAYTHLGVNLTSAAEMRSPGAEGRPFSKECNSLLHCFSPRAPGAGRWLGILGWICLSHPSGENFLLRRVFCEGNCKCACCVAKSTHITEFTPVLLEHLLWTATFSWLKETVSILQHIHNFTVILFYWSIKRMIPFCWLTRQLSGFWGTSVIMYMGQNQKGKALFFPHSDRKRLLCSCLRKQLRVKT